MKVRLLAACFFSMLCSRGFSQNVSVRITVRNEKNETVQNASVSILRVPDTAVLRMQTLTGNSVVFSLKKNTHYFLDITSVGITELFREIRIGGRDTVLNMNVTAATGNLGVVTVNVRKPIVRQEDDKTIIDAEELANSSTNAYEVLEKTPGAVVDQDGNVYLNNNTPATIFINGREVKISATDLSSMLKSLPANSITKIEILRNPSAKYDAASSGGIVNIVLKKGVKLGTNGSVDAGYFRGKYSARFIGFNVNRSAGKLNTYLNYNFTNRTNYEMLSSKRQLVPGTSFYQSSYTKYPGNNNFAGGGLDYEISKKWNIGYDGRMSANNNRSSVENNIDILRDATMYRLGRNSSIVNNSGPAFYLGNNISSKYKIDSTGSEWTNSVDYTYFSGNNVQQYQNIHIQPAANTLFGDGSSHNKKNIFAFKSDLVLKRKNTLTIEAGTKLSSSISRNNAVYYADTSTGKYLDRYQTNSFHYNENIAATYLQVSKTFAGFTIKPGLRYEYTDIRGHQLIPTDTVFSIRRSDLFPYVYVRRRIMKMLGFTLTGNAIYRRSITRPFYEALNPYPKYADQYTYDIGNPRLQPQFVNNYEINITADDFPVFSFGLNDVKNIFTSLTYQKGDTLFRTYDNLGKNKELYLRVVGGIPPGKKYFFYAGAQLNAMHYRGFYNGAPFRYNSASWNFFTYQNYKPASNLILSLNGWMRVNGVVNFFELKTFGSLNFSANQAILKKKMNVILSINDIFRTNKNEFDINVPNFVATGIRYGDTRRVGITLRFNFGIKSKEEKKENFDAPAESN